MSLIDDDASDTVSSVVKLGNRRRSVGGCPHQAVEIGVYAVLAVLRLTCRLLMRSARVAQSEGAFLGFLCVLLWLAGEPKDHDEVERLQLRRYVRWDVGVLTDETDHPRSVLAARLVCACTKSRSSVFL